MKNSSAVLAERDEHDRPTGPTLHALKLTSVQDFLTVVRLTLDQHEHDRTRTARALGVGQRTLYRWLQRYPMLSTGAPVSKNSPSRKVPQ